MIKLCYSYKRKDNTTGNGVFETESMTKAVRFVRGCKRKGYFFYEVICDTSYELETLERRCGGI